MWGHSEVQKFAEKHSLSELARADLKKMFDGVVTKSRKRVTVRVPATTANMGPGFDCAGMALDVWNELTVERAPHFAMEIEGEGAHLLPRDKSNLVVKGVEAAYKFIDQEVPTLRYYTLNRIPFAKGMGSSSAVAYQQDSQILFLGEANFSFASAVCKCFDDCSGITATSFESESEVLQRFGPAAARRMRFLEARCGTVYHSVAAADLRYRFRAASFDCVVFNFPLAPKSRAAEGALAGPMAQSHAAEMRRIYQDLSMVLGDFFSGASTLLKPGGEVHLRLTDQHATVAALTAPEPLELVARRDFGEAFEEVYRPLGYRPAAIGKTKSFAVKASSTWLFMTPNCAAKLRREQIDGKRAQAGGQLDPDADLDSCFLQTERHSMLQAFVTFVGYGEVPSARFRDLTDWMLNGGREVNHAGLSAIGEPDDRPDQVLHKQRSAKQPPDVLKYAAPRDSLREEAAAVKEVSTGTMVGIGAALLIVMIVLNYLIGRSDVAILELAEERSYSKSIPLAELFVGYLASPGVFGAYWSPPEKPFASCDLWLRLLLGCIFWICGDTSLEARLYDKISSVQVRSELRALLILVRVGLGAGEAVAAPCLYQITSGWFPKHQQARSVSIGVAGQCIGAAMSMSFSRITAFWFASQPPAGEGYLVSIGQILCLAVVASIDMQSNIGQLNGLAGLDWRIMFYVFGSAGMLWSLVFAFYGADSPKAHRYISDAERRSVEMLKRLEPPSPAPLPYAQLLRHPSVQGLIVAEFCLSFIWYLWLSWMPSFFHDNFGMSTGEAGTMGLIAYWLAAPAALSWAELSGQCLKSGRWTLRQCRLYMGAVASLMSGAPAVLLLWLYLRSPTELSVALVVLTVVLVAAKGSGHSSNIVDVGGLSNTARVAGCVTLSASLSGAVGNMIVGALLDSKFGWPSVLSAAAGAGVVSFAAFASWATQVKNEEELLQIATNIEGHPDNVAPCIYGGFQLGIHNGKRWWTDRVTMPHGLMCVVFCPDHATETSEARLLLKEQIALKDAIFNCGRVAVLVAAFATGNMDWLRHGTEDALHQEQRAPIHPHLKPLIRAALDAGAQGACLSGAGPAVIAFTSGRCGDVIAQNASEREEFNVAEALLSAADAIGCPGHVLITKPVEHGGYIVSETKVSDPDSRESRIHYVQD
ncbi:thrB [Symbiodinium sp. CCMP2592]|nr:thrB [Symbiodinium sp. CCMP2592]